MGTLPGPRESTLMPLATVKLARETLNVSTFGEFAVRARTETLRFESRAARRLLLAVLVARDARARADRLAADLWPDSATSAARTNLRVALHALRSSLERVDARDAVVAADGEISLRRERWSIDLVAFEDGAHAALRGRSWEATFDAASRGIGAFLPEDPYEPWLEHVRARIETLRERLLAHCTELALEAPDASRASACERLVRSAFDADASNESFAGACARIYQRLDMRGEATRVLQRHEEAVGEAVTHPAFAWLRAAPREAAPCVHVPPPNVWRRVETLPFVGRESDLERLEDVLDRTIEGSGFATIVLGEPGVGKSRVCSELLTRARERGALVLAAEFIAASPGARVDPIALAFDRVLAALGDADFFDVAAPLLSGFGPVLPTLERRFGRDAETRVAAIDERMRRAAIVELARACARRWPVVLYVDDIHLAPQAQVSLVWALAEAANDAPICIVATARESEFAESPATALLDLAGRNVGVVRLDALPSRDAIALAAAAAADDDIEPALVARRARGNALAIVELARDRGRGRRGLTGTIASRLRSLEPTHLALLHAIALAESEPLTASDLLAIDATDDETTIERIESLVRAGFASEHESGIVVAHPLIREVVLRESSATERRRLHARVGELAARRGAALAAASHYTRAGAAFAEAAVHWTSEAIDEMRRRPRAAMYASADLIERALRLTRPDDPRRYAIALACGNAFITTNASTSADAFLEAARVAPTDRARAVAYERLAMHYVAHQRHAEARDACDRGEALGPDEETLAAIRTHRVWLAAFAGQVDAARSIAERTFAAEPPPRIAVGTHIALGCACVFAGRHDEALVAFEAARALAKRIDDWQNLLVLEINASAVHYQTGRLRAALDAARSIDDTIVIEGRIATASVNARNIAECAYHLDDLELASRFETIATRRALHTRSDVLAAEAKLLGAQVVATQGQHEAAITVLEVAARVFAGAHRTGLEIESCSYALDYALRANAAETASRWLARGSALRTTEQNVDQRAHFHAQASRAHARAGRPDASLAAQTAALAEFERIGSIVRQVDVAAICAIAACDRGETAAAAGLLDRARALAERCDPGRPQRLVRELASSIETPA